MVNEIRLMGRIGRDPELKKIKGGSQLLNIAVGTSENYKDKNDKWQEKTIWHDVEVWGKKAESLSERLQKGDLVYIGGKVDYNQYEDDKGSTQRRAKIKAYDVKRVKWSE